MEQGDKQNFTKPSPKEQKQGQKSDPAFLKADIEIHIKSCPYRSRSLLPAPDRLKPAVPEPMNLPVPLHDRNSAASQPTAGCKRPPAVHPVQCRHKLRCRHDRCHPDRNTGSFWLPPVRPCHPAAATGDREGHPPPFRHGQQFSIEFSRPKDLSSQGIDQNPAGGCLNQQTPVFAAKFKIPQVLRSFDLPFPGCCHQRLICYRHPENPHTEPGKEKHIPSLQQILMIHTSGAKGNASKIRHILAKCGRLRLFFRIAVTKPQLDLLFIPAGLQCIHQRITSLPPI